MTKESRAFYKSEDLEQVIPELLKYIDVKDKHSKLKKSLSNKISLKHGDLYQAIRNRIRSFNQINYPLMENMSYDQLVTLAAEYGVDEIVPRDLVINQYSNNHACSLVRSQTNNTLEVDRNVCTYEKYHEKINGPMYDDYTCELPRCKIVLTGNNCVLDTAVMLLSYVARKDKLIFTMETRIYYPSVTIDTDVDSLVFESGSPLFNMEHDVKGVCKNMLPSVNSGAETFSFDMRVSKIIDSAINGLGVLRKLNDVIGKKAIELEALIEDLDNFDPVKLACDAIPEQKAYASTGTDVYTISPDVKQSLYNKIKSRLHKKRL